MSAQSSIRPEWNRATASRPNRLRKGRKRAWHCELEVLEDRLAPAMDFMAGHYYAVEGGSDSVAVGDFSGDGKLDIAVANRYTNSVKILLGNGDGTFQTAANYAVGSSPESVTVGDFNGDGKLDLAVANSYSNNVSILLGNGNGGTFQTAVNYAVGFSPYSVTVGDFNADGKLDLAVANYPSYYSQSNSNVSILFGNGDGTFQDGVNCAFGRNPTSVAVGDFNGDGKPDLAVANCGYNANLGYYQGVSILLGNGDGTFQTAVNYAVGSDPESVTVGDFNGDGKLDLAVANGNGVSILLGNGDGTFQNAVNYPVGFSPNSVTVGDFNADGKLDLAVAGYGDNNSVSVSILLGNGDGSFQAAVNYAVGNYYFSSYPISVTVGDFNADGKLDLAVAIYLDYNVSILLGNGDGTFQPDNYAVGTQPNSVTVGDFNGDGKLDLAVANYGSNTVSILLGNGDGTFQTAVNYAVYSSPPSVAVGDFNGDGKLDLAVANYDSDSVSILLGNGDGTFQTAVNYAVGSGPISVTVGDFNADGKLDLAVANEDSNDVSILLGNGDGTFQNAGNYAVGSSPNSVTVGDFNGDGKLDLAVANYDSNNVSILRGNGDGTFQTAVNYAVGSKPRSVTVGDFNADGNLDLAVANVDSGNNYVSILLGNGDGTFQNAGNYAVGSSGNSVTVPYSVTVGDFNADGKLDLAVANYCSANVSILLGNGNGTFQTAVNYGVGFNPVSVTVGDFNGDGKLDLAVANSTSNNVSILLNTTTLPTVTSSTFSLAFNAATLTINGTGFDPNGVNTVTFNDGAVGYVTSASATSLKVTFSTQPTMLGSLTAVVTTDFVSSGSPVQVATVTPVVTLSTTGMLVNVPTLTINGFGFDPSGTNTVAFNDGAVGTVTSATATEPDGDVLDAAERGGQPDSRGDHRFRQQRGSRAGGHGELRKWGGQRRLYPDRGHERIDEQRGQYGDGHDRREQRLLDGQHGGHLRVLRDQYRL